MTHLPRPTPSDPRRGRPAAARCTAAARSRAAPLDGAGGTGTSRAVARAAALAAALAAAVGAALLPAAAEARDRVRPERISVLADVIEVRPVYREVRVGAPRRECWIEEQRTVVRETPARGVHRHRHDRRSGGADALVGGVIGGVVGNQLGRDAGRGGRAGATIAGAIIGSTIANEAAAGSARHRRHHDTHTLHETRTVYETRPIERCRTVDGAHSQRRLQHYDVTYRYDGRLFVTRLPRDPGSTLELEVTVRPARH